MKKVEFLYDYASPNCYLAWTQLPDMCARFDAELIYMPIFLGGIFKTIGNTTPVSIKPKGAWMFDDISRYAKYYGVPFEMNPHFIFNSLPAMRGAVWAESEGCLENYNKAMFEAAWIDGKNVGDADGMQAIAKDAGIDAAVLANAIQFPDIKKTLLDYTNQAVERGVFGAPTIFVEGVMHFGQDRLPWVERALSGEIVVGPAPFT
jgi:2-hydroxychromene-2-carboxylate isomerase